MTLCDVQEFGADYAGFGLYTTYIIRNSQNQSEYPSELRNQKSGLQSQAI
jgi:hypothetical protein